MLTVAVVGFIALSRPDGRSLADLMSGSVVVGTGAADADRPRGIRRGEGASGRCCATSSSSPRVVALSVLGVPFVLTSKGSESPEEKIARMRLEAAGEVRQVTPRQRAATDDLRAEFGRAGRKAEDAVAQKHREVLSLKMASARAGAANEARAPG